MAAYISKVTSISLLQAVLYMLFFRNHGRYLNIEIIMLAVLLLAVYNFIDNFLVGVAKTY